MGNLVDACVFVASAAGTGDFTVGSAAVGWRAPAQAGVIEGQPYHYRAFSSDQTQWEIGTGTLTGTTFARTTVLDSSQGGGAKTNFAAAPRVALTAFVTDFISGEERAKLDFIWVTQPVNLDELEGNLAAVKVKTDQIHITQYVDLDAVEATADLALAQAQSAHTKTDWLTVTQPVNLDQMELDIVAANSNAMNARAKTDWLTVTQPVNLDQVEAKADASFAVTQWVTVTQAVNLDQIEADTVTNNAKVSFPEAPSDGKQYARRNTAWSEVLAPVIPPATYIGDTPPASPSPGQIWWESDSGDTFLYYNDGNTSQWVQISGMGWSTMISDAPADSKTYARKNNAWVETVDKPAIDAADALRVLKAGDTMTGDLIVNTDLYVGGASGNNSIHITGYSGAPISTLTGGSTAGSLLEAPLGRHHVIGLRDNDGSDSFSIVSHGGDDATGTAAYDTLAFRVTATGIVTTAGSITTTSGYLGSGSTNGVFFAGGGSMYFRPQGAGVATNQMVLNAAGDLSIVGSVAVSGSLATAGLQSTLGATINGGDLVCTGRVMVNSAVAATGTYLILAANANTIYFRPNGTSDVTNQMTYSSNGVLANPGRVETQVFRASSGFEAGNPGYSATGAWDGKSLQALALYTSRMGTTNSSHINFYNGNGLVGTITTSGSATVYNTSSDETLKDFIGLYDPAKAIEIIRADPVRDFHWKVDGSYAVGWGAQTSYGISPDLASPPPEDMEGATWGMDQSRRTPYLWAALANALDRIEALEAKLVTLGVT